VKDPYEDNVFRSVMYGLMFEGALCLAVAALLLWARQRGAL
jgi:hypothetical protein